MSLLIPFPLGWLLNKKAARFEVNISLAFLHWVEMSLHPWPFVSDIAIFVLKGDVKLQLTNWHCWQVCSHIARCYSVAAQFEACRTKIQEISAIVKDISYVLYFRVRALNFKTCLCQRWFPLLLWQLSDYRWWKCRHGCFIIKISHVRDYQHRITSVLVRLQYCRQTDKPTYRHTDTGLKAVCSWILVSQLMSWIWRGDW